MPTVGEQLRQARETQKLSISEVAETTNIRGDHLRALEEGNYGVFSAPVYIRGFVRTYSLLLKLDTARLLEQLGQELAESGQVDPSLTPPARGILDAAMFQLSKISRRFVLPIAGTVAVLAVLIAIYLVWNHVQNQDPTTGVRDARYAVPASSGDTLPLPRPQ